MVGVINLDPDRPHALADGVGHTEEPGSISVTACDSH
jgi:hypothetical protein